MKDIVEKNASFQSPPPPPPPPKQCFQKASPSLLIEIEPIMSCAAEIFPSKLFKPL